MKERGQNNLSQYDVQIAAEITAQTHWRWLDFNPQELQKDNEVDLNPNSQSITEADEASMILEIQEELSKMNGGEI